MPVVVCEQCGKSFQALRSRTRFCGRACYGLSKRKRAERACAVCGGTFEVGGRAGKWTQQFCSVECQGKGRYRRGREANDLSPVDAAYIAGFIDADGSFLIHGRYDGSDTLAFRVQAAGTKPETILWLGEATGVGNTVYRKRWTKNPRHNGIWQWQANGDAAWSVARQIAPYLKVKRQQAELGIEFHERLRNPALKADPSWQREYRDRMRELNARGRKETGDG